MANEYDTHEEVVLAHFQEANFLSKFLKQLLALFYHVLRFRKQDPLLKIGKIGQLQSDRGSQSPVEAPGAGKLPLKTHRFLKSPFQELSGTVTAHSPHKCQGQHEVYVYVQATHMMYFCID
uniref:Uncharacterized protein n=1 Tax=Eutreptiella gymnastica TaxID=73025 RepID=A0A7S1NT64_9EUGL|mmetsp:Transcript_89222/g.154576  ORF Transcript_89222/g.154576 Transcript_89222/m.154576 type:complete len:121 (+) Transcript_89222:39-401(+)